MTQFKGHTIEAMVQAGEANDYDIDGNDEADHVVDAGVKDLQHGHMGWKYAARLKTYTRFMGQVHNFIVEVRKAQTKMLERFRRERTYSGQKRGE